MSEHRFFSADARAAVKAAVEAVEAGTAAEIVVAVRRASGPYRAAELLAGLVVAFAVVLLLLFLPQEFRVETMPLEILAGFVVGLFVARGLWPVKRAFVGRGELAAQVRAAAREAFVDLGVSRTTGRTGVLVFVSIFERAVEVVADVGVAADGPELAARLEALAASQRGGADLEALLAALGALGAPLAAILPRAADDVNELPDEPRVGPAVIP